MTEYDYLFKIIIIGNPGVGKSSLLIQYADHTFDPSYISTIGVDFKFKTLNIDGKIVKAQFFDTAGHERFRSLAGSYYKSAHGIIIMYDITSRDSFLNIDSWIKDAQCYANPETPVIVIGNKTDLDYMREIDTKTAVQWCQNRGLDVYEVSAKEYYSIETVMSQFIKSIMMKYIATNRSRGLSISEIKTEGKKKKKRCC